MQRNALIIFSLIVLAGLVWYTVTHPQILQNTTGTATSTPSGVETYTEDTAYYTIDANYPKSALAGPSDAAAVFLMKTWVLNTAAQFKADGNFKNLTQEDIEMRGFDQGRKQMLEISYLVSSSSRTLSYIFTIYTDTGGAHGNIYFKTFVFDSETGAALSLANVFAPGAKYLARLSEISRRQLPSLIGEYADAEFIESGTAPNEENFQNFYFDGDTFVLLFPPYQVGPYALGPITLRIPATELKSILKLQYP